MNISSNAPVVRPGWSFCCSRLWQTRAATDSQTEAQQELWNIARERDQADLCGIRIDEAMAEGPKRRDKEEVTPTWDDVQKGQVEPRAHDGKHDESRSAGSRSRRKAPKMRCAQARRPRRDRGRSNRSWPSLRLSATLEDDTFLDMFECLTPDSGGGWRASLRHSDALDHRQELLSKSLSMPLQTSEYAKPMSTHNICPKHDVEKYPLPGRLSPVPYHAQQAELFQVPPPVFCVKGRRFSPKSLPDPRDVIDLIPI
jgi:hypothetical protein